MAGDANAGLFVPAGKLFTPDLKPRLIVIAAIVLVWALWGGLIYAAAYHDDVRYLKDDGRGLLEHFGYQACFLTGPLVMINTYFAVSYFLRLVRKVDRYVASDADPDEVAAIVGGQVNSILLGGIWKWMLFLFGVIGVFIAFWQFSYLDRPGDYWGNDVFNAEAYGWSWAAANAYLLVLWGLIYPIGLFYVGHIAISSQQIVRRLLHEQMLRLDLLHADGCAGMARFGTLNLILMMIYSWMGVAVWVLMLTHRNAYFAVNASAIALSILFVVHSFLGIYWVFKAVRNQREIAVERLNSRIGEMMDGNRNSFDGAAATMQYRDRVLAVAAVPYAPGASAAVNVLRYGPAAIGFAKIFLPLSVPI